MSLLGEASFDKFVFLRDLLFSLFSLSIFLLFVFFFSSFRFFFLLYAILLLSLLLYSFLIFSSYPSCFISFPSLLPPLFCVLLRSMHCSKVFLHYWEDSFRLQTIMFTQMQKIFTYRKLTKHISKMFAGTSKECL